jgi:hypothetical protein
MHTRERRRGIALIEGLIAVSTIVLFLGATLFFHDLFRTKGQTMREARYQAWTATRPGCGGSVTGNHMQQVVLPSTLHRVDAPRTLSVASSTQMQCNAAPTSGDSVLSAIGGIMSLFHL